MSPWSQRGKLLVSIVVSCVLCFVSLGSTAIAEDISFEVTVDSAKIPLGSAGQLSLTVHGAQDLDRIDLPAIDGFEARYIGPSTQVSVVNGEYSSSKTFRYMLLPLKEGTFTIPSIDVTIKGQTYHSQPLAVQVLPVSADAGGSGAPDQHSLVDRVHMIIATPRTRCYVNEELPLVIKMYVKDLPLRSISLPDIRQEGFVLSEYGQPRQYEETLQGQKFSVIEYLTRLTPVKTGVVKVGPAVVSAELVMKTNVRRNPFSSIGLDDDFFSGLFGGSQTTPVTITALPLDLEVLDLPSEGVPADFSGAVGRFTFDATVTPAQVKVGDPLTLRLTVSGVGNLKGVKMPSVKDARFKIYEPLIKDQDGQKVLEQVIIPVKDDIRDVPALSFSYFDTGSGQYQTMTRGPFPVEVKPLDKGQEFQAVGFSDKSVSLVKENFGRDIVFIKDRPGVLTGRGEAFQRNMAFYAVLVAFLNIWGIFVALFYYRRRIYSDPVFARRAAAFRQARKAWKDAGSLMTQDRSREFYDVLLKALRDYLSVKLELPAGVVDVNDLEAALSREKIDEKTLWKLRNVFAVGERVCFAGGIVSGQDMQRDHLDVEEILEAVEKKVK
ncbi:MAG: protein BatD [Candidatus Omnitrophica bacterium]|nr:protein BatD [Candidatus Omnitrophota bacterium]